MGVVVRFSDDFLRFIWRLGGLLRLRDRVMVLE